MAKIRNDMKEIKIDRYLKQLIESRQNGFIKVVTGIRSVASLIYWMFPAKTPSPLHIPLSARDTV